jgi:uncharacterized membrane protein
MKILQKNTNNIINELKKGIKETSKYLFSHHTKKELYKCYCISIKKQKIYFCSRCLGIYIGIIFGLIFYFLTSLNIELYYLLIFIFPFFTYFDWNISSFTNHKGNNLLSTFFGILLGMAYILGLILLFNNFPDYIILLIGLFYITISLFSIYKKIKNK